MGYLSLEPGAAAPAPGAAIAQSWTITSAGARRAVVLGGLEPLRSAGPAAGWLVEPVPVLQIGIAPATTPVLGRVVSGEYRPGTWPTAVDTSRSLFAAIARQPGFCGTLVGLAADGLRTFSLSLWEGSLGPLVGVDESWFAQQVARFDECYTGPPEVFSGELGGGPGAG